MVFAAAIGQFFWTNIAGRRRRRRTRVVARVFLENDWRDAAMSVVIDRCIGVGLMLLAFSFVILLLPTSIGLFGNGRSGGRRAWHHALCRVHGVGAGSAPWRRALQSGPGRACRGAGGSQSRGVRAAQRHDPGSTACCNCSMTIGAGCVARPGAGPGGVTRRRCCVERRDGGYRAGSILYRGPGPARSLATVSLFGNYGLTPERALVFSMYFGFSLRITSLPGAVAWFGFLIPRPERSAGAQADDLR